MFLKCSTRRKDGKIHRSWSIVESRRVGRHVVQKHVLYLGEVSDQQRTSWARAVSVIDETSGECRQLNLIPCGSDTPKQARGIGPTGNELCLGLERIPQ